MTTIDTILDQVASLPKGEQRQLLLLLQDRIAYNASRRNIAPPAQRFAELDNALHDYTGRSVADRDQRRTMVWARHLLAYQMRTEGYSLNEIGRCIRRDHTTVLSSLRQVENMMAMPQAYRFEFAMLRTMRERAARPQ